MPHPSIDTSTYSPWFTSWTSGIVITAGMAGFAAVASGSSTVPEWPPLWLMGAAMVVMALVFGVVVALVVRAGLQLAGCRRVVRLAIFGIPAISLLIIGILSAIPIESHAVMIHMKSGQATSDSDPLTTWIPLLGLLLLPGLVSFAFGKVCR